MSLYWKRNIIIETNGQRYTGLKIHINLKREVDGEPPSGSVMIYNLSEEHRTRLHELVTPENKPAITVMAGYGDLVPIIFTGAIDESATGRNGLSHVSSLKLASSTLENKGGVSARSFLDEPMRAIAVELSRDMGLLVGSLLPIPEQTITFAHSGTAEAALTTLLARANVGWYEDNGILRFKPKTGKTQGDTVDETVTLVTPKTGLIGAPERTEEGARIKTLLNPFIQLNATIEVRSQELSEQFKAVMINHQGDNWDGTFVSSIELRSLTENDN